MRGEEEGTDVSGSNTASTTGTFTFIQSLELLQHLQMCGIASMFALYLSYSSGDRPSIHFACEICLQE